MNLKEQINADFMEAYKAKNMEKKNFLGVVKGTIQTEEGNGILATDENIVKLIKKIEKNIKENMTSRKSLNLDITEQYNELSYLSPYLPQLMSADEIRVKVKAILETATNKNIGFVIGTFNKENTGLSFDNNEVMLIIKEELNG